MPVLSFKGKTAVENHHHAVPHHVFELNAGRSVLGKGEKPSLDGNLIIEGDNLLALKALLPTHAGRIKCIYIDPPYNTGNENWVYNDNLTQPQFKEWIGQVVGKEGEDATRHDKWCCMMYPRLQLLRELLREDGAIFISIDDNEVHHLRGLMDEVFGANNFIATIVWQKMDSPKNTAIHFSEDHDYIVAYARQGSLWRPNALARTEEMIARYKNPDSDPRGPWLLSDLAARNFYDKGRYPITTATGRVIDGPPAGSYWRVSREKFDELDRDGRVWWGTSGANRPGIKRFLSEVRAGVVPQTLWFWKDVGSTRNAKQELSELMDAAASQDVFITPKPTGLIERIVQIATAPDDVVLDSFAGSGTTAHAVIRHNAEDNGHRRFILVQQPHDSKDDEKNKLNICDDITAERVRRVMRGYTRTKRNGEGEKKEKAEGLGGSFTYARLGAALLGEHKTWGESPPAFGDLAQYIYFTETSRQLDPKQVDEKTGKLGEHAGTSYYLLYTPNPKQSRALDRKAMEALAKDKVRRKVVYCEKLWLHRDELAAAREQGNDVRPMLLPFQVK